MGRLDAIRLKGGVFLVLLLSAFGGCKREPSNGTDALGSSLIFDNASPEVREALASPVDFRINDDNFGRWEEAQSNLEALPRSALPAKSPPGGNVVDRAVARLESSPYTRTAIERTGLSVREFILETIALAQATEVARTGKSLSRGSIPRENFQFVQRYSSRALYSRSQAARGNDNYGTNPDVDVMSEQRDGDLQLRLDEAEHQEEMRLSDLEVRREEMERAAEAQREQTERAADRQREEEGRAAEMSRERADSARDTVPNLRR
jgi:hypothetical protein